MAMTGAERQRNYRARQVRTLAALKKLIEVLHSRVENEEKIVLEVQDVLPLVAASCVSQAAFLELLADLV